MRKNKGRKSIKTEIAFSVTIVVVLAIVILFLVSNYFLRQYLLKQTQEDIEYLSKKSAELVSDEIDKTHAIIVELANNSMMTDSSVSEKERVDFYQGRAKKLGFELFFYINPDGEGKNLTPEGDRFDLSETDYFKRSMSGEVFTTDIIVDELTGENIVIISAPYYDGDKIKGVFAGVSSADYFSEFCKSFNWKDSSIMAIVSEGGRVIGHKNEEIIENKVNIIEQAEKDNGYVDLLRFYNEKMMESDFGSGNYSFKGIDKLGGFSSIEGTSSSLLISIDKSVVFEPINYLNKLMIILFSLVIIVTILTIYFITANRISIAFNNLKIDIEQLANYNLNYTAKKDYSNRKDEIGDIYRASVVLKNNLIKIVTQISKHAISTAETAEALTQTTMSTNEMAKDLSRAVNNIAEGASGQANDTTDAAQHVEVSTRLTNEMIDVLNKLIIAIENIDNKKDEGKEALAELQVLINNNKSESNFIQTTIIETNESAENISRASEMIQSIADQTNLLALNAAIELAVGM